MLLPSRARVDLRVWLERLGMCGCMNLFLISHTFWMPYFLVPLHSLTISLSAHAVYIPLGDTHFLVSFLLSDPWSMLRHGRKATVT